MTADRRRRRQPAGPIVDVLDLTVVGRLLRQAGFIGCPDDPVSARGRCNADGTLRTIKARYPGGWCCRLTRHVNGTCSVTQSISFTVAGSPRGNLRRDPAACRQARDAAIAAVEAKEADELERGDWR